ncbi:MAG: hypothetical protein ACRD3I_01835 [Terriglobales bacterium]
MILTGRYVVKEIRCETRTTSADTYLVVMRHEARHIHNWYDTGNVSIITMAAEEARKLAVGDRVEITLT